MPYIFKWLLYVHEHTQKVLSNTTINDMIIEVSSL
jgi:hypothetical protein